MEQTLAKTAAQHIIWLVDGRQEIHSTSLDKVVKLAKLQQSNVTVIFDSRLRTRERHYWFMLDKSEQTEKLWQQEQQQKQQQLTNCFSEQNVPCSLQVLDKATYREAIEKQLSGKKDCLLILQDQDITDRHPVFQDLANMSCNVLVMRKQPWSKSMKLLGAVDPMHENSRPDDLDFIISKKTRNLAKLFKCEWFIGHACHVPASFIQYKSKIATLHRQGLDDFIERIGATAKHGVLLNGLPEKALSDWIQKQQNDILVIGNVTRNVLLSHLIGSTTMALLNKPPCDLYLVKSRHQD